MRPIRKTSSSSTCRRISTSRLEPVLAAIDAGVVLPTINDGFTGKAPDLGAYEFGQPLPQYGPRTPVPGAPMGDGSMRTIAGPPEGK